MRFGLDIAQQRMPFAEVVDRARFAEALGFDGVWGFDHFEPMYGEGPGECFEGMTTLAALATATTRVRLGLLVTGLTYRPLGLLATQAITVDHASNGRLELAIGTAWHDKEHRALGFEFPPTGARVDLLEDALNILPRLFTEDDVTYAGKRVSVARHRQPEAGAAPVDPDLGRSRRPEALAPTGRSVRRRLAQLR
ncbi:MAG: LLM class flavin-dependent oxidoreductase [Actinomycetota bacterium]